MFSALLNQLVNSIKIVGRTVRAFLMRYFTGAWSRVRRLTSFSRQVARLAPKAMQSAALAGKKPTRREDYVETGQLFVSKSFLLLLLLGLVILVLAVYFLIWPFLLSHFFTARMVCTDSRIPDYTGKVIVYYDEEKSIPMYSGKLEEGLLQGKGSEFDADGVLSYEGTFVDGIREGEGKAFRSGVLVYEGDFSNGSYEGQGTLYDENGMVYEGGFASGLRQGEGTSYGPDGTCIYRGDFVQDQYQGEGTLYEEDGKTLQYQGGFLEGKYSGTGKLYENGTLSYSGELEQGVFQGQGTQYWPDGTVRYTGGFSKGEYDQEGKLYAEDGTLLYSGGFSQGQYQGEGTQYDPETGRRYYAGGFEAGSFQGSGTIYPDESQSIEAEFEKGKVQGTIRWYKNGLLYYSGEAEDLLPEGYGTLSTTGGETVFQGDFAGGTIDGGALLGMDLGQLTKALGDCSLTTLTDTQKNGFTLQAKELGFTAFLSYQQDSREPEVYYVYLYSTDWFDLLAWDTQEDYEAWLETTGREDYTCRRLEVLPDFAGAVPFAEQKYERAVYTFSDHVFSLWFDADGTCFMIEWYSLDALPEAAELSTASEASDSRTKALMDKLGLLEAETDSTAAGDHGNESYGSEDVTPVLQAAEEQGAYAETYAALLTYYENAEILSALEETLSLDQELLAEATVQEALGNGEDDRLQTLSREIDDLEKQAEKCRLEMEMRTLEIKSTTELEVSDYDLQQLALVVDPMELETDALWQDALDAAQAQADAEAQAAARAEAEAEAQAQAQADALQSQIQEAITQATAQIGDETEDAADADAVAPSASDPGTGTEETPILTLEEVGKLLQEQQQAEREALLTAAQAEEPESTVEETGEEEAAAVGEVDEEALLLELKLGILDLEMAYSDLKQALADYETADAAAEALEESYSLGTVTQQQVYEAMAEKNEYRSTLYSALAAYDRKLMELNLLCGSSLSRDYDWLEVTPAEAA